MQNRILGLSRMNTAINILVAEDNSDDLFLLRQAFKKAGWLDPLHAVCDGLEALAYLKGEESYNDRDNYPFPDVLLLDLNMPRMNGFEVLKWVRQDPQCKRLVVHVLTASARGADVKLAYDLHANGYVIKPSRMDELVAFVASLRQWLRFTVFPPQPVSAITGTEARVLA
jgi:CheY-like chemotaxis protein